MPKINFFIQKPIYGITMTFQYKKDLKLIVKQGKNLKKLERIIYLIATAQPLPPKCKNHKLIGNFDNSFECHIEPDWLLIYRIDNNILILSLLRTGSHSDLFGK